MRDEPSDELQEIFAAQDARRIVRQAVRAEMARWPLGGPVPTGPGERIVTRLGVAVVVAFLTAALVATSLDYVDSLQRTERARIAERTRLLEALTSSTPASAELLVCQMRRAQFYEPRCEEIPR